MRSISTRQWVAGLPGFKKRGGTVRPHAPQVFQAGRMLHREVYLALSRAFRASVKEPFPFGKTYFDSLNTLRNQGLSRASHLAFLQAIRQELEIRLGFPAIATPDVSMEMLCTRVVEMIRHWEVVGKDFSKKIKIRKRDPQNAIEVEPFRLSVFKSMRVEDIFLLSQADVYNQIEQILIGCMNGIHFNAQLPLEKRGVVGENVDILFSHLFFHYGVCMPYRYPNGRSFLKPETRSVNIIAEVINQVRDQVILAKKALSPNDNTFLVRFPKPDGGGKFFIWVATVLPRDTVHLIFEHFLRAPEEGVGDLFPRALEKAAACGFLRLGIRTQTEWGKFNMMGRGFTLFRPDGSRLI